MSRSSTDGNQVFLSVAVAWEIVIKTSLGRMSVSGSVASFVRDVVKANRFRVLPTDLHLTVAVAALPPIHPDPFDRLLICQAF